MPKKKKCDFKNIEAADQKVSYTREGVPSGGRENMWTRTTSKWNKHKPPKSKPVNGLGGEVAFEYVSLQQAGRL